MNNKNIIKKVIICILIFIGVNLFTNYRYFYNFMYKDSQEVYFGNDYKASENAYVITDINKDIKVIQIIYDDNPYYVTVSFTNDDFKYFEHLNKTFELDDFIDNTSFFFVETNGVKDLLVWAQNPTVNKVIINPHINYYLNLKTTLTISLLIIGLVFVLENNKKIDEDKLQRYRTIVFMIIMLCLSHYLSKDYESRDHDYLYQYYTDSLMQGHLTLDYPVEENLRLSENPYDTSSRNFVHMWDASYYNGHYYSYFGIWPNVALLIPYKLITGNYMSNNMATLIYGFFSILASYFLFKEIIKKYLGNTPYNLMILSFIYIIFGSKLIWCLHRPSFYEFIAFSGYFHVILGLYLVLFNNKKNKIRDLIGYTSLALTALCRPTYLLMSALLIPKLIKRFKEKDYDIKDIIILIVPYLIIGLITMYLNYHRFGSIFEFGIKYQLTVSNLINVKFSFIRSIVGSFYYLFENFNINLLPLSISGVGNSFPVMTDFYVEPIGGGFIFTSIIGILLPFLFGSIKDKDLRIYSLIALVNAIVLLALASGIGSLIGRYMLDFNYILYFIVVIEFLYIINEAKNKHLNRVYVVLISLSIVLNYMLALSNVY